MPVLLTEPRQIVDAIIQSRLPTRAMNILLQLISGQHPYHFYATTEWAPELVACFTPARLRAITRAELMGAQNCGEITSNAIMGWLRDQLWPRLPSQASRRRPASPT